MKWRVTFGVLVTLSALTIVLMESRGQNVDLQQGIEVQGRGPIHEAFAQPTVTTAVASSFIQAKPPDPIEEVPPTEQPAGVNVVWMPGYWAWDEDRNDFLWVSGIWREVPPGHHWIGGYWQQVTRGWQWISGYWAADNITEVEVIPTPPNLIPEAIPPAPNVESVYVPGIWVYHESRFMWRPGFWVGYRPGWVWTPASYCYTPVGYTFVEGYWDHDFDNRGLIFAPVYIDRNFYGRPGWFYRPGFVLDIDLVFGSLFVDVAHHHYFAGDYYDARYRNRGIQPWVDVHIGAASDPVLSYYRVRHHDNPRWEEDLRATYTAREQGTAPRPAHTLVEQQKQGKQQVAFVKQLSEVKTSSFKLEKVSQERMTELTKHVQQVKQVSMERQKIETSAKAKQGGKEGATKLELPKQLQPVAKGQGAPKTPPPLPNFPQAQAKSAEGNGQEKKQEENAKFPKGESAKKGQIEEKNLQGKDGKKLETPKEKIETPKGKAEAPKENKTQAPKGKAETAKQPDGGKEKIETKGKAAAGKQPDGLKGKFEEPKGKAEVGKQPEAPKGKFEEPKGKAEAGKQPDGLKGKFEEPKGKAEIGKQPESPKGKFEEPKGKAELIKQNETPREKGEAPKGDGGKGKAPPPQPKQKEEPSEKKKDEKGAFRIDPSRLVPLATVSAWHPMLQYQREIADLMAQPRNFLVTGPLA